MRLAPAEAGATDPSLALRAGMGQPAPAEDEPIHTSPKRQRGACEIPPRQEVHEVTKAVAQEMSQTLSGEASCAEAEFLPNEAGAHFESAQFRHVAEAAPEPLSPRFVAGTVPSTELRAGPVPSSSAGNQPAPPVGGTSACRSTAPVPYAELKAGPVSPSIPTPTAPAMTSDKGRTTNDQGPMTGDQGPTTQEEMQQKRFDALPRRIQLEIEDIRQRLWHHNGRPHLRKEQVSELVAFIDKHLGEDSVGPESCLRPRRRDP